MFKFFSKSCEPLKLKDSFLSLYLLYLSMLDRRGDRFTKIIPLPLGIVMKFDLYKFWWLKILKEQLGCDQSQEKIDITKRYIKRFFWGKKFLKDKMLPEFTKIIKDSSQKQKWKFKQQKKIRFLCSQMFRLFFSVFGL